MLCLFDVFRFVWGGVGKTSRWQIETPQMSISLTLNDEQAARLEARASDLGVDPSELAKVESKATALCFSLVMNHPFVDGNKRIGHAAMETFLVMNGFEIAANVAHAATTILTLAAGELSREELLEWVTSHIRRLPT